MPSRIVHLPLSWNDPQAQLAMRKYQELVRPDAPWCPCNIEFIRRINGLDDRRRRCSASSSTPSYLVLGLGDVYLGAPVATPLDPRHRLVTTKYNPARTWTPENAVGIGGAYMCVYGMEGPGRLSARRPHDPDVEHAGARRRSSSRARPGCCASSTRSASIPVSAEELTGGARGLSAWRAITVRIEEGVPPARLSRSSSHAMPPRSPAAKRAAGGLRRRAPALAGRRARTVLAPDEAARRRPGTLSRRARRRPRERARAMSGSCWSTPGRAGRRRRTVAILESMKMEIAIPAPAAGARSSRLRTQAGGRTLRGGDLVAVIQET